MSNSKLIVVEGAQGAGKTTITDYLRYSLSYTNLYRLSGTSDSTKTGLPKAKEMYETIIPTENPASILDWNNCFNESGE